MKTRISVLLGLLALLSVADAQAQSVAGTYTWEFPARIRRDDSGETVEQKGQAKLSITVKGDSIVGTLSSTVPGAPSNPPPRDVRGTVKGSTIEFRINSQARIVNGDDERTVETVQIYNASITGDDIKGTIAAQATDGSVTMPSRTFAGKRTKTD